MLVIPKVYRRKNRRSILVTRKYVPFVMQRISVAVQIAAASEIRQALGRGMGPDSA